MRECADPSPGLSIGWTIQAPRVDAVPSWFYARHDSNLRRVLRGTLARRSGRFRDPARRHGVWRNHDRGQRREARHEDGPSTTRRERGRQAYGGRRRLCGRGTERRAGRYRLHQGDAPEGLLPHPSPSAEWFGAAGSPALDEAAANWVGAAAEACARRSKVLHGNEGWGA